VWIAFLDRTDIEVDHVRPRVAGGTTDLTNLQLRTAIATIMKSVFDGSATHRRRAGLHAKSRVTEEPNAAKWHGRFCRRVVACCCRSSAPGIRQLRIHVMVAALVG
jgi:hypothetical protein